MNFGNGASSAFSSVFYTYNIEVFISYAVAILLFLGGIFMVLMVVWGGFRMIISGGKDDRIKPAIQTIRNAVFGIIIIIMIIFILPGMGNLIGVDIGQYVGPTAIFSRIQEISEILLNNTIQTSPFADSSSGLLNSSDSSF